MAAGKKSFCDVKKTKVSSKNKSFSFGKDEFDILIKEIANLNKKLDIVIAKQNRSEGLTVDELINGTLPPVVEDGFMQTEPAISTKNKKETIVNDEPGTITW